MAITLTTKLILDNSDQYDVEIIRRLNLSKKNISIIFNSLQSCINLVYLDLSYNLITKIEGFDSLVKLEHLDLSFNQIRLIGIILHGYSFNYRLSIMTLFLFIAFLESLSGLQCLKRLNLIGNEITSFENLKELSYVSKLWYN